MGMDVYGKSPASEQGKYFRNNVWFWRPLATYVCEVAPGITSACRYWQSNDGDGLDASASKELADVLQAEIDSGRCEAYAQIYAAELAALPRVRCSSATLLESVALSRTLEQVILRAAASNAMAAMAQGGARTTTNTIRSRFKT